MDCALPSVGSNNNNNNNNFNNYNNFINFNNFNKLQQLKVHQVEPSPQDVTVLYLESRVQAVVVSWSVGWLEAKVLEHGSNDFLAFLQKVGQ